MSQKHRIFEDVGGDSHSVRPAPEVGVIDRGSRGARGAVRVWLGLLFVLLVAMIAVGGMTRLTDSGLAITEWRPVTGALPPSGEAEWQQEFEKYQATPEYKLQNRGMSLAEFRKIYWWEWGHRQLGRVIGAVWALGFLLFLATRRIPPGWTGRLLLPGVLGAAQGAIGWWMVASGLTGSMRDVASSRLAVHLGLAFIILGVIAWLVMRLGRPERVLIQARRAREPRLMTLAGGLAALAFVQILLGALVAGLDAGRNFTDWPWMGGDILPPYPLDLTPLWRNLVENVALVQFMHRIVAYLLVIAGIFVWTRARHSGNDSTRRAFDLALGAILVQVVLGVVTLMNSAPLGLGVSHQLVAVVTWVLILRARFESQYPHPQSIRKG